MTNTENITTSSTNPDNKPIIHVDHVSYDWNTESKLDISVPVLTCKVVVSPGVYLYGAACGNHFWVSTDPISTYVIQRYYSRNQQSRQERDVIEVEPFFTVEALGNAYHEMVSVRVRDGGYRYLYDYKTIQRPDSYGVTYDYNTQQDVGGFPYNYLKTKITFMGESVEHIFKFKQPEAGEVDIDVNGPGSYVFTVNTSFFGLTSTQFWSIKDNNNYNSHSYGYRYNQWQKAWNALTSCTFKQDVNAFLIRFFQAHTTNDLRALKGIEKRKEIKPVLARLEKEEPLLWAFYSFLKNGHVVKKMSNNRLLASVLLDCGKNYKKFKKQLETVLRDTLGTDPGAHHDMESATRAMCMRFPTAIKADAQARSKAEWNLREGLTNQAQGLGIDPRRHKTLMRAIAKKQISLSIFHTTGDPLNLINAEFDLWERALRRKDWAEVIYNICNAITNKNRFEKHITPYLSFLFRVEKYLKRHTGRNWIAFPKLVNSEAQLEMQERDENGTVKTRSALTPIADNEKNTITVPYAGLKMYGAQTTYCYSKHYFVFEKDTIDEVSGSVVVNEVEKKLNGRDDYGLMYYTLDGSVEAQGYPTFLIIFERRKHTPSGELKPYTFVHFHRVHPSRKKNGRMVPACRLVEECYRYMAGNIRAEEIFAQQGDLIFIKTDKPSDFKDEEGKAVAEFESHRFATGTNSPVKLWPNESKSIKNRLGFINSDHDFVLEHPEHEHVPFTAGYYEIRRCKSYENNPAASWTYTCD